MFVGQLILETQTRQFAGFVAGLGLVVVGDLKQRAATRVALRLQGFDQLLERQVLMGLSLHGSLFDLLQQLGHGGLRRKLGLEHLSVDEETDQPFGFAAVAVGNRHADTHIVLPAVAMQQGLERGQQQHEQGDALLPGKGLEAIQQRGVQFDIQACAMRIARGRTWTVGGQFQHGRLITELIFPVFQLPCLFTHLQPVALPDGVVGVLDQQRLTLDRSPQADGLITLQQFLDHDRHRPAVGDDVVLGQHQHVFFIGDLQQPDAQQRSVLQIERLLHFVIDVILNRLAIGKPINAQ